MYARQIQFLGERRMAAMFNLYTFPAALALIGSTLSAFAALFIFAKAGTGVLDAMLIGVMSATMAAAVFYYTGVRALKTFGLPLDTTVKVFHRFMHHNEWPN